MEIQSVKIGSMGPKKCILIMCLHGDIYPESSSHTCYTYPVGTEGGETHPPLKHWLWKEGWSKGRNIEWGMVDRSNACEAEVVVPESDP